MDTKTILNIIEVVISIALVVAIIMQQQGSGLGSIYGGTGGESYRSKRGVEKVLFNATVILIVLFVVFGLAIAIISAKS